jgi:hypothetical protein
MGLAKVWSLAYRERYKKHKKAFGEKPVSSPTATVSKVRSYGVRRRISERRPAPGRFMMRFAIGETVIIRYGTHQGKKGRIIRAQQADVYEVKVEDGFIFFFSGKGLEKYEVLYTVRGEL